MRDNNIHLYSRFAYAEKLRIENLHTPFSESSMLTDMEHKQIAVLFAEIPWLNQYYSGHIIPDLQIFDVVDDFSNEPYISVFLFKHYCGMFKHNTTETFGYVEDNNCPLGFSIGWTFAGSTSIEDLLRTYMTKINFKEALDFFLWKTHNILERYIYVDLESIGSFRKLAREGKLAENKLDPIYTPVYDELYRWIELKAANILTYAKQHHTTILSLSGYCLESIPKEICDCTDLQSIDLSDNRLTSLPDNIQKLNNLKCIDLSQNDLSEFPIQLKDMGKLETIYLDLNYIEILPSYITSMKNLHKLNVDRNPIKNVPTTYMEGPDSTRKIIKYLSTL